MTESTIEIVRSVARDAEWPVSYRVTEGGHEAVVATRFALAGPLAAAYPAGAHDREVRLHPGVSARALRATTERMLLDDPRCRRVVLPVPEEDLTAIAFAEGAGYRYVVDVETTVAAQSLLVTEPDWVLAQPAALDRIPLDATAAAARGAVSA